MLNKNIQKCQQKIINDHLDHVSPEDIIKKFETLSKYSLLISKFVQLESKKIQDYFPKQEISRQDIQILTNNEILSARVILMAYCFQINLKESQFKSICSLQNKVYKRLIKLKEQYAERFLLDIGLVNKSLANNFRIRNWFTIQNYKFYLLKAQKLHQKEKNYQYLEDRHDYIQWMFPNHFQSMFNSDSWPMSYFEVQLFRQSRKLGLKILKSVRIFFDFLGIQLHPDYRYEIISKQRLKQALYINCHNHLRLRRVLACLSITGFRNIALSLIKFLGELVRTKTIYSKWKFTFERQWEIYGNKNLQNALKLCFHPEDKFPQTHQIWKQLRSELDLNAQQQVAIDWNQYDQNSILKLTQILKAETSGRYQMKNFRESSDEEQKHKKVEKDNKQNKDNKLQNDNKDNKDDREEQNNFKMKQQNISKQSEMMVQQTKQIGNPAKVKEVIQQKISTPQQNQIEKEEINEQIANQSKN